MADSINPTAALTGMAIHQMQNSQALSTGKRLQALSSQSSPSAENPELRRVANEFEAMFINQMLQHMTAGIKLDSPFSGGPGEEMFRSLLNQEYATGMAKRGGFGIAEKVYRQMLALQET